MTHDPMVWASAFVFFALGIAILAGASLAIYTLYMEIKND